ncbi:MAG: hypothetical protein M8354_14415 [Halalkalicoccus sp.]|nr:hypothetical protein [Halalkalicoccus sp.]
MPLGLGAGVYRMDRSYTDEDGDGIPDSDERSVTFQHLLERTFGDDQVGGLDPRRADLLLDVRYVGDVTVSYQSRTHLTGLFRRHGIHIQWLQYPYRYELDRFEREYGYTVEDILWSPRSFYHNEIDPRLKDVALQVLVVPNTTDGQGKLRNDWGGLRNGAVAGMSFGNRAVVTAQGTAEQETKLLLHEIAHLALCHDDDPTNTGVMGTVNGNRDADLLPPEWVRLRDNLDNVRDTTEVDVIPRRCLWEEHLVVPASGHLSNRLS